MFHSRVCCSSLNTLDTGLLSIAGSTFIELQRAGMGSAQGVVVTSEERIFLKTRDELISNQEGPAKFIKKGQSELLAFKLKIPLRANQACSHSVENKKLQEEHGLLPPCLSFGGPNTVKIQYRVNFISKGRFMHNLHNQFTTQAVACKSVIVVPTRSTRPMSLFTGPCFKEKDLRHLFSTSVLGEMRFLAHQPPAIFVVAQKAGPLPTEAVAVGLVLKVTSKSEADLPQVIDVKRSFTSLTYLSTVPWNAIPTVYPGLGSSIKRGLHRESFKLSKFKLLPKIWERVTDAGSGKADYQDSSVYVCHFNIPIYPTVDMDMIPTFYSCLAARQYFAKFSLSFPSRILGRSSISLEVPVDIVHVDS